MPEPRAIPSLRFTTAITDLFRQKRAHADLVVYLQATPEVLKKRRRTLRGGEKAISDDYLEEVIKVYEHFFFHYTSSDLLIVNISEIDFVERSEDLQAALLRRVSEPIRGTQYFLPLGSGGGCREGREVAVSCQLSAFAASCQLPGRGSLCLPSGCSVRFIVQGNFLASVIPFGSTHP